MSSSYWPVYNFFASQSLHNIKKFKKKSGEANDSVIFPFFILLHKRAKPIHPPYIHPSAHLSTHTSAPHLCDAVGGAFYYLVLRMQNPCRRQAIKITLGANATTCRRQAIYILVSIPPPTHPSATNPLTLLSARVTYEH